MSTEKTGNQTPPPYVQQDQTKNASYAQSGPTPQGGAYPALGEYPPGAYIQGGAYPMHPQAGFYYGTNTSNVVVTQPGCPGQVVYRQAPTDYMVASVLACICCFWPTGLCAIYFALQAKELAARGDFNAATRMSNNARNMMISSILIGIIWITLVIVLQVVVVSRKTYHNY